MQTSFLFIFPFQSISLYFLLTHKHRIYGSSFVRHCLPRGHGSASCPYQCWVMVVFPACNKSRRWHRMSAASCAGTPNMYPLAPTTLSSQRKCYGGLVKLSPIHTACFLANESYCTPVCLGSKSWLMLTGVELKVVHLQFIWSLISYFKGVYNQWTIFNGVTEKAGEGSESYGDTTAQ